MNADTFNTYSVTCPICHQTSIISSMGVLGGLFTCPHCHTHFVISKSGHFVRDPFCLRKWAVGEMLRRQSHPWARIRRDLWLTRRFPLAILVSGILFISLAISATNQLSSEQNIPNLQSDPMQTEE
ncbi:MAG: hypothetical protein SWJ54_00260 [Cyanobacteriota bacterium]|nr:hypothetical protein [Cyanobacteriota bacterium]